MSRTPSPREVAGYIGNLGRFLRARGRREDEDQAALTELRADAAALDLPPGLEIEWLGTAGYRLTYEGQTVFLDPYLSRSSLGDVLRRRRVVIEPGLYATHLDPHAGEVLGVLVGHTHFDHAIDVPAIAGRYDAPAYGSRSLTQLMRIHGQEAQAVEVEPHRAYELGPFTVRFIPSLHSKLILGLAVPSAGELTCEHLEGLTPSAYKCGDVYGIHIEVAGRTIYHQGSANLIDDQVPTGGVDLFLAGIAGRGFTEDYWSRILRRLEPRVVVASHFDDFFRPVEDPVGMSLNVALARVPEEIGAVGRDFRVVTLRPFESVSATAV
ncbi:MAG: MBL fold metallo-hydrolase [Solirubrobacteraceae bacterium]|nr:MBL fold metallo-hydrolase [Patulibacter sp.]